MGWKIVKFFDDVPTTDVQVSCVAGALWDVRGSLQNREVGMKRVLVAVSTVGAAPSRLIDRTSRPPCGRFFRQSDSIRAWT